MALSSEDLLYLKDTKNALQAIIRTTKPGASRQELLDSPNFVRFYLIEGGLATAWNKSELKGSVKIMGMKITEVADKICNEVWFGGGLDIDYTLPDVLPMTAENVAIALRPASPFGMGASLIAATDANTGEEIIIDGNQDGFSVYTSGSEPLGFEELAKLGEPQPLSLQEYLDGVMIKTPSVRISRRNFIKHQLYTRLKMHNGARAKASTQDLEDDYKFVDTLMKIDTRVRDLDQYLYLSVCQDLEKSPDIHKFISYVESLEV